MSEQGGVESEYGFEPDSGILSSAGGLQYEPTNVTRGAALATLLRPDAQRLLLGLTGPLEELGFSDDAIAGLAGGTRLVEAFGSAWYGPDFIDRSKAEERLRAWTALNQNADPTAAIQFLIALLGSNSERESVAGAAALARVVTYRDGPIAWLEADVTTPTWPDQPRLDLNTEWWTQTFEDLAERAGRQTADDQVLALRALIAVRLRVAAYSNDPVVLSMVEAVRQAQADDFGGDGGALTSSLYPTPPGALVVSTMVHGTFGWKGSWWRPKGAFHHYVGINLRNNLYNRGARFSWSGAYSQSQRLQAAEDLVDWAGDVAPNGMQSVFAHSYGGEVAAIAATTGAKTHELILLSAPGTQYVNDAATAVGRIVDIRMKGDLVLFIAGTPQRLVPAKNLTEVTLGWNLLGHSATHDPATWVAEDIPGRAGL